MFNKDLSIIIPFYNEASRIDIHKNLRLVLDYMNSYCKGSYELILIDDCSKDVTYKALSKYSKLPKFRVISCDKNHGKGYCLREGFKLAKYDYILYMDADLAVDLDNIETFIESADDNTCVIADRYSGLIKNENDRSPIRNFMSFVTHKFIIKLCGLKINDSQCGFKLFKKSKNLNYNYLKTSRWLFDLEFLRYLQSKGYKFIEIPVVWNNCKNSTLNVSGAIFSSIYELFIILTNKF